MKSFLTWTLIVLLLTASGIFLHPLLAQSRTQGHFTLQNEKVKMGVWIKKGTLAKDCVRVLPNWAVQFHAKPAVIQTDGDFALDVMWTGWRAPGKINNAENPVIFTKKDFQFERAEQDTLPNGQKNIVLHFKGKNNPFLLKLSYSLKPEAFFVRRTLALRDTVFGRHFLRKVASRKGRILSPVKIVNPGSFGQPVAFTRGDGGGFFGLEYPTSQNSLATSSNGQIFLSCSEVIGKRVKREWLSTDPVVEAVTPNSFVKYWFFNYIDDIRVTPPNPYILYNTWYDLRSPLMVKDSSHVMNEENIKRIIHLFKKNMVEKYGIRLNAFVLDDGWDVYRSDWVLRKKQFPGGLKPISDELEKMGTHLGIWFGPIGGYSHRTWRVTWMRNHGYETVGDEMCLAGKNYSQLFKKRVVDFVEKDGVRFYKWDGIQFSCSEPNHGHKIGIYSRKAITDTVVMLCRAVRKNHPDVYLNVTSGTWLSPWWLKWANQIWMQSGDYGFSDVPSLSRRDAAMTYRDLSLYKDFTTENLWFPISNMMTHGIIKGNLQELGKRPEPLSKFTDNALLYFARGVSMWELYISPDLLTDGEWQALAKSIEWAKDRFPILEHTEMVGGNPGEREPYAYVHFSGDRGIIAARNPFMKSRKLAVTLEPSFGMNPEAASLVLERVYPNHWVSPEIYAAGAQFEIPLQGYETAVYEVYPLEKAHEPLLGGAIYDVSQPTEKTFHLSVYATNGNVRWLNPEKMAQLKIAGNTIALKDFSIEKKPMPTLLTTPAFRIELKKHRVLLESQFNLSDKTKKATLAILMESDRNSTGKKLPSVEAKLNGKRVIAEIEQVKGKWQWLKYSILPGENRTKLTFRLKKDAPAWSGRVSAWVIGQVHPVPNKIDVEMTETFTKEPPMPPRPLEKGVFQTTMKLGSETIHLE